MLEHRLGLAPPMQHDQREPVATTVTVVECDLVPGRELSHVDLLPHAVVGSP